jgi:dephospho-CoA kinase
MPAIGITGGISTGKTTFCECLLALIPNATLFDADEVARSLADDDSSVKNEIRREFGAEIYSANGDLNRGKLRSIVLQSAAKKSTLEQILHPRIRRQWSADAQTYRKSQDFFFADIPLLYETGGETLCDRVVVVACSPEVQLARLLTRGMEGRAPANLRSTSKELRLPIGPDEAMGLISSQMQLGEKIKRADHVVWNNNGREVLAEQARDLVNFWCAQ